MNTKTPQYLIAFPDFGEMPIRIPPAWTDESDRHGACPSFTFELPGGNDHVRVFVGYEDKADPGCRYRAVLCDRQAQAVGDSGDDLFTTGEEHSIEMFMALVALRAEVVDWQVALAGEREGFVELCFHTDAVLGLDFSEDGGQPPEQDSLGVALNEARKRTGCPYLACKQGKAPDTLRVCMLVAMDGGEGTLLRSFTGDLTEVGAVALLRSMDNLSCATQLRNLAHDAVAAGVRARLNDCATRVENGTVKG